MRAEIQMKAPSCGGVRRKGLSLMLGGALMAWATAVMAQFPSVGAPPSPALEASAQTPVVRAQVVAARQAVLSSELSGKLLKLPYRDGETFAKGSVLAEFDCSLHKAKLNRSIASESAARKQLDVANRLDQLKSISVAELAQAQSAVSVGQAESAVDRAMVQRCVIKAPFAGRVGETHVRESEFVPEGKELLSIHEEGAFEVEMIVPSRWLAWLEAGHPFQILVDETARSHRGTVSRIAGSVDPVSQSVRVIGKIADDEKGLLPGMSGTVQIEPPAEPPASPSANPL